MKATRLIIRLVLPPFIAVAGTLIPLFAALWLWSDPILNVKDSFGRDKAKEEILRVFCSTTEPTLSSATRVTLTRVAFVVVLSTVLGATGGFILCRGTKRWNLSQPLLDFLRSTPATLWIGVASAFFLKSRKDYMAVALATIPCSLIMVYQLRHALSQESEEHRHVFRLISRNTTRARLFFLFTLPKAVPAMLTGVRLIVSYSLVLVVVLEMCGASGSTLGIGDIATKYNSVGWPNVALAWFVGCVGFTLNKMVEAIEEYVSAKLGYNV